ncbi:MAG: hypothetical protein DRQ40_00820 [Gammaproteobacteria bacterium]|nr:MAG: hypothetical protein DRQ40_00820 [Gammaproteobacteria bacterium]
MVLREDIRQYAIYKPDVVVAMFEALQAAMLVSGGARLERRAAQVPSTIRDDLGVIGSMMSEAGFARQQINAGLAPNDVPDELAKAQRMWDVFVRWEKDPSSVDFEVVKMVLNEFAGAMAYLNERTHETGTFHPRWNAGLVSGQPCESCGR